MQCIYFDPPYGIKFKSNWQVSTRSKNVQDGKIDHVTKQPEQVKAFRDTWKNGIHSYLTYLRDRLTVMHDLLAESGSIFVQISDQNVHRVRVLLDEIFGHENFCGFIPFRKRHGRISASTLPEQTHDFIIWYAKSKPNMKYRQLYIEKNIEKLDMFVDDDNGNAVKLSQLEKQKGKLDEKEIYNQVPLMLQSFNSDRKFSVEWRGKTWNPPPAGWSVSEENMKKLAKLDRFTPRGKYLHFKRFYNESGISRLISVWNDTSGEQNAKYVVQTSELPVQRCILMVTDPGDLVLDPTCGSGTTASVAERFGRRWVTIDTSRVALAIARTRLMSTVYPFYYLADSAEGRKKEELLSGKPLEGVSSNGDIRYGFVYKRKPHITAKSITENTELDVIWEKWQRVLIPTLERLNACLKVAWRDWEIPFRSSDHWTEEAKELHSEYMHGRKKMKDEINQSIVQNAKVNTLFDDPYEDKSKVRVAGPFTVETLSPYRALSTDQVDFTSSEDHAKGVLRSLIEGAPEDFVSLVIQNLKTNGVQQYEKTDRIMFSSLTGWPGDYISASGIYENDRGMVNVAIFIGPEFGSISKVQLLEAAREAKQSGFDEVIACGFNYDAHASGINEHSILPIRRAKINPELHMGGNLKSTKAGNLFVVFGEPDIELNFDESGEIVIQLHGIDVLDTKDGIVRSSKTEEIATWFVDTNYNSESFFVRQAYFLGNKDTFNALKSSLKNEIDEEAWSTLHSDKSRPFPRPTTGKIAVKVINHYGDEVMKVFDVAESEE